MPRLRTVSTKVTQEEFVRLAALAHAQHQPLSVWVRTRLQEMTTTNPRDVLITAELLALRTILLNLHFAVVTGELISEETMKRLIARADAYKHRRATDRLLAGLSPARPSDGRHESAPNLAVPAETRSPANTSAIPNPAASADHAAPPRPSVRGEDGA